MDFVALLSRPPLDALDDSIKDFLRDALVEDGAVSNEEDLCELLGPYLLDAGLASDDAVVAKLCRNLFSDVGRCGDVIPVPATRGGVPVGKLGSIGGVSDEGLVSAWEVSSGVQFAHPPVNSSNPNGTGYPSRDVKNVRSAARVAAANVAATTEAALKNEESIFRLLPGSDEKVLAAILRAEWVALGGDSIGGAIKPSFLAASLCASSDDLGEGDLNHWCASIAGVLEDAGAQPEDRDEFSKSLVRVCHALVRKGLLGIVEKHPEVGDLVQACLPEDDQWHPALIEKVLDSGAVELVFVEYAKPMTVMFSDLRQIDLVDDDDGAGELKQGSCEMCERQTKLTFHHLIPKDTHPTYLKKRLPRGIEGEPTRGFLNSYGLMICRKCHNMVHHLASNTVLAVEYNTLEKLIAQPMIARWVEHAKKLSS